MIKRRENETYEQYKARRKAHKKEEEKRAAKKKQGEWIKKFEPNYPNRRRAREMKAKINKMGGTKAFMQKMGAGEEE